jgi:hypothetical protein
MNPINEINLTSNPRHWILVIAMNVLVLSELCLSMYLAVSSTEDFTATFIKVFFGMLIPTLVIGALAKRRLRPQPAKA